MVIPTHDYKIDLSNTDIKILPIRHEKKEHDRNTSKRQSLHDQKVFLYSTEKRKRSKLSSNLSLLSSF